MLRDFRKHSPNAGRTVAIYTLITDNKYRAILVSPDVQKSYEHPLASAELNRKVLRFREAVQNPAHSIRALSAMGCTTF